MNSILGTQGQMATIQQGHTSSASCILANLWQPLGRSLTWDEASGRIAGDEEANTLLARKYRATWEHPPADSV